MISVTADGMNEGEAVEWIAELHDEGALELHDADEFVQLLRGRFKYMDHQVESKAQIKALKQVRQPPKELV